MISLHELLVLVDRYMSCYRTYHVVHSAEHSTAAIPFTDDLGIVLGLMACSVFLAREASFACGSAANMAAEEGLCVSAVMLAQVASSSEDRFGCAARVSTSPCAILTGSSVFGHLSSIGR
jgi:hypothetical protein